MILITKLERLCQCLRNCRHISGLAVQEVPRLSAVFLPLHEPTFHQPPPPRQHWWPHTLFGVICETKSKDLKHLTSSLTLTLNSYGNSIVFVGLTSEGRRYCYQCYLSLSLSFFFSDLVTYSQLLDRLSLFQTGMKENHTGNRNCCI